MNSRRHIRNVCGLAGSVIATLLIATSSATAADKYSSGTKPWDTTTSNWGPSSGSYSGSTWDNTAPDSAFLEGSAGTVTLDDDIDITGMTISVANYIVDGTNNLNFSTGGAITNAGNDVIITSGITGSPSVRAATPTGNKNLTFAPTSASMTLGTITRPTDTYVTLGGTTTGNSVVAIPKGSNNAKVRKNGTGTWTVGNVYGGFIYIDDGNLVVNGTLTCNYRQIKLSGGILHYNNPGVIGSNNRFEFRGGSLDNSSGAAITSSSQNYNYYLYGDVIFIGSQGANSSLNLGTGSATMNASRTVTIQDADTTLTIGGPIGDSGNNYGLTKDGAGTLELTGNSTYTGETIVDAGALSITQTYLSDSSSVHIDLAATLNLDFSGTDQVLTVYTNGVIGPTGTWGALGSGADNETAFITGTGLLNAPVPTALEGVRYWDGGTADIAGDGNASSDGGAGTWSSSIKNWDAGAGVAHTNWNNAGTDLAVFKGTVGTVTLAEDIYLGGIFVDTVDGYKITGNTLHFGTSGSITNTGNHTIIASGITGSPSVIAGGGGNWYLTLAPTSESMTLGVISRPSDNFLYLGGTTTGNSAVSIPKGNDRAKVVKNDSGTWTVGGDVFGGLVQINAGTLVVNGTIKGRNSASLDLNAGGRLGGTCTIFDQAFTVPAGATLAPGDPTGTLTISGNDCTINGNLEITIDGAQNGTLAVDPANTLMITGATLAINVVNPPTAPIIIATYGTLSGPFLDDSAKGDWQIDYEYEGNKIALLPAAAGTMIMVR